jgi:Protein of unknown function (DUF2384)
MTNLKTSRRSPKARSPRANPKKKRRVLANVGVTKRVTSEQEDGTYLHAGFDPSTGAYDIIYITPGPVRIGTAASQLGVSSAQLLETAGVKSKVRSGAALTKLDKSAQTRVREMLEIVRRISKWAGSKEQAFAWYRAEPIPAFGSRTAESLVKEGKATAVRDYLDHVATGGFA